MLFRCYSLILAFALVLVTGSLRADEPKTNSGLVVVEAECAIQVLDQIQLAVTRDGILAELSKRTGDSVEAGERVFQLDTESALLELSVAQARYDQVFAQAMDESKVRSAEMQLRHATEIATLLEDVGRSPQLELLRSRNERQLAEAQLSSVKAQHEEIVLATEIASAELRVSQLNLDNRITKAPFAGLVVEQLRHEGEWCQRGAPVLRIVRMDALTVQGRVQLKEVAPHELLGRQVEVEVQLARDSTLKLPALRIDRVDPEISPDGSYRVWTQIENQRANHTAAASPWIMRPGMRGSMSIALSQTDEEEAK